MAVRLRASIGAMIFSAFIAMGLITGALGLYGLVVLKAAGHFVVDTYDRSMMSISFARSASLTFSRMDKEILERSIAPPAARPAIDAKLSQLTNSFFGDLGVVKERSQSSDEDGVIRQVRALVQQWDALRQVADRPAGDHDLDTLAEHIIDRLDMLIELTADHSFVSRRKAVDAMTWFNYSSLTATVLAISVSAIITLLLARRIVRPLSAAAAIANRIAAGELQTPIPRGGSDETGMLLRSMTVMQDNIRVMVEREQAQRRSAQNRLVEALESSQDAMILVDGEGKIVIANSQLAEFAPNIARAARGEAYFVELFGALVTAVGSASDDAAAPSRNDLLAAGSEFRLADGRWLRVSRSTTQDGGFFLVLSDFTEFKEREQHLHEAKRQAEAASAAKSSFLANMSHELRTPLNAIIGFSEIIAGEMFGRLGNAKYREYAGNIETSGRHLLEVINSVLDLTKSQAGKLQLNPETVDLVKIVESCATIMREQCSRAQLVLRVTAPSAPLFIWADAAKLRQILLNLLSNAVKFTEPGGHLSLFAEAVGNDIMLRVADTGIGMAPEDMPIALAPFGQVDSRLARRYEGTGLGLPLTKALVELHGGEIAIASTPGLGTTVTVRLRRHQAAADPAPTATAEGADGSAV